jgi:hypothetical protein
VGWLGSRSRCIHFERWLWCVSHARDLSRVSGRCSSLRVSDRCTDVARVCRTTHAALALGHAQLVVCLCIKACLECRKAAIPSRRAGRSSWRVHAFAVCRRSRIISVRLAKWNKCDHWWWCHRCWRGLEKFRGLCLQSVRLLCR